MPEGSAHEQTEGEEEVGRGGVRPGSTCRGIGGNLLGPFPQQHRKADSDRPVPSSGRPIFPPHLNTVTGKLTARDTRTRSSSI